MAWWLVQIGRVLFMCSHEEDGKSLGYGHKAFIVLCMYYYSQSLMSRMLH
jgi:hypothetical protein